MAPTVFGTVLVPSAVFNCLPQKGTFKCTLDYAVTPSGKWRNDQILKASKIKSVLVAQPCPTLCDPIDYSLPGSSVHGIFQAKILEWVAISFSRDLLNPGIEPRSPALQAGTI